MATLFLDLETYNETPITVGTHRYAETAEITLFAYALDDAPVAVWDLTEGAAMPQPLHDALGDPAVTLCAHNSAFDRTVLRHRFPQLALPVSRWEDTLVQAYAHSLPGALDELCFILGVGRAETKDMHGHNLMLMFCKPKLKDGVAIRASRHTHPGAWERFKRYAGQDIEAMRAVKKKMPTWNSQGAELTLWHLDQTINDRGVLIDTDLVCAAIKTVTREQKRLAAAAKDGSGGAVDSLLQRDSLLKHILTAYGVDLPDLQAATLERRINDPTLPAELRNLLAQRLQACTSSTAKYRALHKAVSTDGRLRGTLQFNGATRTGRWAGRLFQPQNLPRPTLKQTDIDNGIAAMKADVADLLAADVMALASNALRGCIIAPPGHKLVIADLSNIEGRVLAWLAEEDWKTDAFRAYDQGKGHDLYALAYAKAFGVSPQTVMDNKNHGDGNMRQIGKVMELALGYGGGVGAFLTFAAAYAIDLEALGEQAWAQISPAIRLQTADAWDYAQERGTTYGLSERAWHTCDAFKRLWRNAHPNTTVLWLALEGATKRALSLRGSTQACGKLAVRADGAWLRIRLPSGRCLCYPGAKLDGGKVSYQGVDQYSRKWTTLHTYGGKLVENAVQAISRDLLAANLQPVEDAGYRIVLTVHDEIISEAPDDPRHHHGQLAALMASNPPWAPGLPLAAAGFETHRYRKG